MIIKNFRRFIGLTLILLVALAALAAPATAQDGTGTPTPDDSISHITGYRLEVLFPVVVRFFVDLDVPPSRITDITFTLEAGSDINKSESLDPAESVLVETDTTTELIYNWQLQEAPQPIPFETVNYKWTIRTNDGVQSEVTNNFTFADTNHGSWREGGDSPLKLYWQGEHLDADPAWREVMPVYNLLSEHTGLSPQLAYAIYDPGVPLCQEARDPATGQQVSQLVSVDNGDTFPCSIDDFKNIYAAAGITLVQRTTIGFTEFKDTLIEQMVRDFYGALWGSTAVPAWFETGLARLYRTHAGYNELQMVRAAARTDALLTFDDLSAPLPPNSLERDQVLWNAESYLLVLYLADQVGEDTPIQLAMGIAENEGGFEGAWQTLMQANLDSLWNEWNRWLFSEEADEAVLWTPYLPAR